MAQVGAAWKQGDLTMAKKQKALSKKDKAMIKKALLKKLIEPCVVDEISLASRMIAAMKQINQANE